MRMRIPTTFLKSPNVPRVKPRSSGWCDDDVLPMIGSVSLRLYHVSQDDNVIDSWLGVSTVWRGMCVNHIKTWQRLVVVGWVMTVQFINKYIVFSCLCEILRNDVAKKIDLCKSFLCQSTEIRFELATFVLNCCVKKKCNLEHRMMMRERSNLLLKSL